MQRFLRLALAVSSAIVAMLVLPTVGRAQGVTTGGIAGTVMDSAGGVLAGATVRITSPSTGFSRITTTRENGRYVVSGLETGTYRVAVAAIGFGPQAREGVRVLLSQTARADFTMGRQAVTLQEIVTTAAAASSEFAPTRTGAQTFISDSSVRRLPTLNRLLQDFVRLTPQVVTNPAPANAGEVSIAGQNYRYNAIQVDGTTQNDKFGLSDTGELGGQANGRGISLEAVKEYQVVVSPYNVTLGGFTGGLISAVTKNGTNKFAGTGFYTTRNQDLVPNVPLYSGAKFLRRQYGGSLGGPIIKDKLHFFAAAEGTSANQPAFGPYIGQPQDAAQQLRVDQALVDRFNAALAQYGIDGGSGGQEFNKNPITNLVGRLDWAVSSKNRVVLRGIYNKSQGDDFSRSTSTFTLSSNRFKRDEWSSSITGQFFSNFNNGATNELQLGVIRQRFARVFDNIGPQVTVSNVPSPLVAGTLVALRAGPDSNSHINQLDQDVLEFRNDLTMPLGNGHLVTLGARAEVYKIRNAFWQNAFGSWRFESMEALEAGTAFAYGVGVGRGDPIARFTTSNLSFYLQDQWTVNPALTLTYGVRAEVPRFKDKPTVLADAFTDFGRKTDEIPTNTNINPRLGFNFTPGGSNGRTQVRGGVGFFSGTPSYVWMSNLYTANGNSGIAQFTCPQAIVPAFTPENILNAPQTCSNGSGPGVGSTIGTINTADPNYKQPQVVRATLGFDRKLPWGLTGTMDAVYTYALKSPFMVNLELADPTTTDANGRVMYGTLNATTGQPTTIAKHGSKYGGTSGGGVYDLTNSKGDYSYGVTAGLAKRFAGSFEASAFYSYQRSYSVADFTSSVARSVYQNGRTQAGNQLDTQVDPSSFDRPHRITASMTYTAPWKNFPTDISFIYIGQSGTNFTYTYSGANNRGDRNADGVATNDPIYIAPSSAQMAFVQNGTFTAAQQAAAYDALLADEPCIAKQKGEIMGRNTCRNPWFNQLDLSVRQSLPGMRGQKLTLQADIFNFLNFLNQDWGQYKQNNRFPQVSLLTVTGQTADGRPTVQMDTRIGDRTFRYPKALNSVSYWQGQVSLRYAF